MPAKTEEAPARLDYDPAHLEAVCRELDLRMAVLYGSRASGTPPPTADSDLDLAVLAREPCSSKRWWTWYRALSEVFDRYLLDLVCLGDADPLFRYEILHKGILLYGDPDDFLEYRAFAYRDFVDSADLRRLEEALFQKKMAFIRGELYGATNVSRNILVHDYNDADHHIVYGSIRSCLEDYQQYVDYVRVFIEHL